MTRPHETALVRQVLAAVSEYSSDSSEYMFGKARVRTAARKPHDETVTEAVHATLKALGFKVLLDGSIVDEHDFTNHRDRTTKYFQNMLGYCVCATCQTLPTHEPTTTGQGHEGQDKTKAP